MRCAVRLTALLLLVMTAVPVGHAQIDAVNVRRCRGPQPTGSSADELRKLAIELVQSSNFNTAAHPKVLNLSVAAVQDQYRRAVAGDCLVVSF